jgi:hypothetical protein
MEAVDGAHGVDRLRSIPNSSDISIATARKEFGVQTHFVNVSWNENSEFSHQSNSAFFRKNLMNRSNAKAPCSAPMKCWDTDFLKQTLLVWYWWTHGSGTDQFRQSCHEFSSIQIVFDRNPKSHREGHTEFAGIWSDWVFVLGHLLSWDSENESPARSDNHHWKPGLCVPGAISQNARSRRNIMLTWRLSRAGNGRLVRYSQKKCLQNIVL